MERLGWKLWAGVTVPILLILAVELVAIGFQHHDQNTLMREQSADTTAIIRTITHADRQTFTEYLSGYWTSKQGLVRLDFSRGKDSITFAGHAPIPVSVIAENFGNGNLEFSLRGNPKKIGWVRKIWNADAISLQMPGKTHVYLYHYMPLEKSKTVEMKIKKEKK